MIDAPNQSQIAGQLRTALAAGGPIAAIILAKTGWSLGDYQMYLELALYIVPPLVAAVWSYVAKRDASLVSAAGKVEGAKVVVDTEVASPAVAAVAENRGADHDVVPKNEYRP